MGAGNALARIFVKIMFVFFNIYNLRFLIKVVFIYTAASPVTALYLRYIDLKRKIYKTLRAYGAKKKVSYWEQNKENLFFVENGKYKKQIEELDIIPDKTRIQIRKMHQQEIEIILAEIDHDGDMHFYENIVPNDPEMVFRKRRKNCLYLVSLNGYIGVKKEFDNESLFINELEALQRLAGTNCKVPSILEIDLKKLSITFTYVMGEILRDKLALAGARVRARDIYDHPDFKGLNHEQKKEKRITEGRKYLDQVVDPGFIESLYEDLNMMHVQRIVYNDIKYGNVVIENDSGKPYWIDLDSSLVHTFSGLKHRVVSDIDVEKFNLHFNTNKPTYQGIKNDLANIDKVYAPVYFGLDLKVGELHNIGVGYGRWHYILKKNMPDLKGKRILDLGTNNGFNAIHMLKEGASEVTGVEIDEKNIIQGELFKTFFEWADQIKYNFRYIKGNMNQIPNMDLGEFDIVTAFCSIYYLSEDDLNELIAYLAKTTNTIVIQCNEAKNIGRSDAKTYIKASLDYNIKLIEKHGFIIKKVAAPRYYSRPLIIGEKL